MLTEFNKIEQRRRRTRGNRAFTYAGTKNGRTETRHVIVSGGGGGGSPRNTYAVDDLNDRSSSALLFHRVFLSRLVRPF